MVVLQSGRPDKIGTQDSEKPGPIRFSFYIDAGFNRRVPTLHVSRFTFHVSRFTLTVPKVDSFPPLDYNTRRKWQ